MQTNSGAGDLVSDLVKALQDLLDDHQHMEPHHADLCQTCLSAAAALRKAGA